MTIAVVAVVAVVVGEVFAREQDEMEVLGQLQLKTAAASVVAFSVP